MRRCLVKILFYLELWRPSCSAERNHLGNFAEGIMRKMSVKLEHENVNGS